MKKKKNEDFILVGHLQVLDEALSSLYSDRKSGQYFLFVRVYEDDNDNTFVLTQVQPSVVPSPPSATSMLSQTQSGNISRAACVSNSAVLGEDKVPLNESEANKNFI